MLETYSTYLIDLDGVVYRGEELLPGAREFVSWLEANNKKYLFPTNNSFASDEQVLTKLARLGIKTSAAHVLGAAQAAVQNIARRFSGATIYVVGEAPLVEMVRKHNLLVAPSESNKADIVLVGLDRNFDYQKLDHAVHAIMAGAQFIAVNRDRLLPVAGRLIPGCGAMVAAIEAASNVTPEVVGKPQPMLIQEALRLLGSQPGEAIMIGDSLDTDIQAGKAAGTHTLLVLSGKDSRASIAASPVKPDYIYDNLATLLAEIR